MLASLTAHAQAASITGIDLQLINDSNPAKAEFERDIEATSSVNGRVTASLWSSAMSDSDVLKSGAAISASASFEHNNDIEALGESRYRLGVGWFRDARQRAGAPFVRASLGLGYLDSETTQRDGPVLDASASINIQPAPFYDATLGLVTEVRDADTEVFDTNKTTLFATVNFSPFTRLVLRTGVRYVIGDEVSSSTPTVPIVNTANIIEADPAFGGMEADRFAYLIDANSAILEAGIGYDLTSATELNLLYRFIRTEAEDDISYDRTRLELTLSLSL